jgi:TRAP-type C4-dicarboxylate transport system substrate-binding protein
LSANKDTWAKLPDSVKKIITEEVAVYEAAVGNESATKYSTALANLKKQGVTVRDLGDVERKKMAVTIEPWVNQKAAEYEAKGFPGKESFRRLMVLLKEGGAKPIHTYTIK